MTAFINMKLRAVSSRIMIKQRSSGSVPDYAMVCSISEGMLWINRLSILVIAKFPNDVQGTVKTVWESLSPSEKNTFTALVKGFPSNSNLAKLLIKLSAAQLKQTFGTLSRVAIVGPANVGKSTLYNQLIHERGDIAKVSPLPGTTRVNQEADAGIFEVVDTPGADAVGEVGEKEKEEALKAARGADFLVILFDSIQGIKKTEIEIFQELSTLGKPFVVALNKVDLVKADQVGIQKLVASHLGLEVEQVIPVSAKSGKGLDQLLVAIAAIEPRIVAALGKALPEFRWRLAWRSIISSASLSAVIALIPLPVIDFAPLVINQATMVLGLARIYDYKINFQRARELVVTFGLGIPRAGIIPGVEQTGRAARVAAFGCDRLFHHGCDGVCSRAVV